MIVWFMFIFLDHIKTFGFTIAGEVFAGRWWWRFGGAVIHGGFLFLFGWCVVCWWFFLQQFQVQIIIDAIYVDGTNACDIGIVAAILFASECFVKCFIVIPWIRPSWNIFYINQIVYIIRMSKVWWFAAGTFGFGEHFFQYWQIPMVDTSRFAIWFEAHRRDLLHNNVMKQKW